MSTEHTGGRMSSDERRAAIARSARRTPDGNARLDLTIRVYRDGGFWIGSRGTEHEYGRPSLDAVLQDLELILHEVHHNLG